MSPRTRRPLRCRGPGAAGLRAAWRRSCRRRAPHRGRSVICHGSTLPPRVGSSATVLQDRVEGRDAYSFFDREVLVKRQVELQYIDSGLPDEAHKGSLSVVVDKGAYGFGACAPRPRHASDFKPGRRRTDVGVEAARRGGHGVSGHLHVCREAVLLAKGGDAIPDAIDVPSWVRRIMHAVDEERARRPEVRAAGGTRVVVSRGGARVEVLRLREFLADQAGTDWPPVDGDDAPVRLPMEHQLPDAEDGQWVHHRGYQQQHHGDGEQRPYFGPNLFPCVLHVLFLSGQVQGTDNDVDELDADERGDD